MCDNKKNKKMKKLFLVLLCNIWRACDGELGLFVHLIRGESVRPGEMSYGDLLKSVLRNEVSLDLFYCCFLLLVCV